MGIKHHVKSILRPLYRQYLSIKNQGEAVSCNICNKSYKSLRPIKGRHADGSIYIVKDHGGSCWKCNSYPRTRQLYYWLINNYDILSKRNIKILHVAPELQIAEKLRHLHNIVYKCLDKHCEGYSYPGYVEDGDLCNLPFEDSIFDVVICNHVLEHIINDNKALSEIMRVLKHDGTAILMVPIDYDLKETIEESELDNLSPAEREIKFGQFDHVRQYGLDYFQRLNNVGFHVTRLLYNQDLTEKFGFVPGEEIIVCNKEV